MVEDVVIFFQFHRYATNGDAVSATAIIENGG